nr:MAG TPA: hypothetical protein [Caudoviricetes sp.]
MISINDVRREVEEEFKKYLNTLDEEEKRNYFRTTPDIKISTDELLGNMYDPFGSVCAFDKYLNQFVNVPTIDLKE